MHSLLLKYVRLAVFLLFLISCSNNTIQNDAKRLATMQCKALKLMKQVSDGDISLLEESTNMANKASALQKEFELKYTSDRQILAFKKALEDEGKYCK